MVYYQDFTSTSPKQSEDEYLKKLYKSARGRTDYTVLFSLKRGGNNPQQPSMVLELCKIDSMYLVRHTCNKNHFHEILHDTKSSYFKKESDAVKFFVDCLLPWEKIYCDCKEWICGHLKKYGETNLLSCCKCNRSVDFTGTSSVTELKQKWEECKIIPNVLD